MEKIEYKTITKITSQMLSVLLTMKEGDVTVNDSWLGNRHPQPGDRTECVRWRLSEPVFDLSLKEEKKWAMGRPGVRVFQKEELR